VKWLDDRLREFFEKHPDSTAATQEKLDGLKI
jgi:hypothetical protein